MIQQRALTAEDICRKLKPIYGEKINKIYFNYITSEDKESKEEMLAMMNALYQKHFDELLETKTLLAPPKQVNIDGEFEIGEVTYGDRNVGKFALREQDFQRHVCISGMSGSGKTTLAFNILDGFIAKDKPFLVFDWKKSFRPLLAKDNKLVCFTVGDNKLTNNFKLNLNQPPKGVSPKEWITVICDLVAESFFVSYGVHKILLETLDEAFKEYGIYSGSENYPTWHHIKWRLEEKLDSAKSRAQGWIESALRVATVLTFGDFGEVMNYKGESAVSVEDIMKNRVVFEMNSLGNIEKKFFCEFILMYIYKLKKATQNEIKSGFNYAILVDEAHNIFLKDKTNFTQESVTDMIYREMREYGVGLICLDQHISKLSDTVKGNSACHIAFQQQLPEDIDTVSRLMHLYDQKEFFSGLEVGSAVVKLSDRHTNAFSIKAPWMETRELKTSDQQIKDRASKFLLGNSFENNRDEQFTEEVKAGKTFDLNELFKKIHLPKLNLRASELETPEERNERKPTLVNLKGEVVFDADKEPVSLSTEDDTVYATIQRRLANGEELNDIEKKLEAIYNPVAVMKGINRAMENKLEEKMSKAEEVIIDEDIEVNISEPASILPKREEKIDTEGDSKDKKVSKENGNLYKSQNTDIYSHLNDEETKFISFLEKNPDHDLTTVKLYEAIGFSPRKGNKIKVELMEKDLLKIEEVKYSGGWKKMITLKQSSILEATEI